MLKLSIITINYNNREGLEKTIESVEMQQFADYEYIVIDGGSNDGSLEVIKEHGKNIDQYVSEPDNGIYNAMNKGVRMAHGEYLQFLNSGDCLIAPDSLQQIFSMNPSADIISSHTVWQPSNQCAKAPARVTLRHLYEKGMNHQSTFIRRNLLEAYPYDETLRIASDYKFFFQAFILGNATYQMRDVATIYYDETGISTTSQEASMNERRLIHAEMLPPFIVRDCQMLQEEASRPAPSLSKYQRHLQQLDSDLTNPALRAVANRIASILLELNRCFFKSRKAVKKQ